MPKVSMLSDGINSLLYKGLSCRQRGFNLASRLTLYEKLSKYTYKTCNII